MHASVYKGAEPRRKLQLRRDSKQFRRTLQVSAARCALTNEEQIRRSLGSSQALKTNQAHVADASARGFTGPQ